MSEVSSLISSSCGAGPSPTVSITKVLTHSDIRSNIYFSGENPNYFKGYEILPSPGTNSYYLIDFFEYYLDGKPNIYDIDFTGITVASLSTGGAASTAASISLYSPGYITHSINSTTPLYGDASYLTSVPSLCFDTAAETASFVMFVSLVDHTTDTLTTATTPFAENTLVQLFTTDTLPTGLSTATDYYIKIVGSTQIQLLSSPGGSVVLFTNNGSGTLTIKAKDAVVVGDKIHFFGVSGGSIPNFDTPGLAPGNIAEVESIVDNFKFKVKHPTGASFLNILSAGSGSVLMTKNPRYFNIGSSNNLKFNTGDKVVFYTNTGLPTTVYGIDYNTEYYVVRKNNNQFGIAATLVDATQDEPNCIIVGFTSVSTLRPNMKPPGGTRTITYFDVDALALKAPLPSSYLVVSGGKAFSSTTGTSVLLSPSAQVFTSANVNTSTDEITITSHGFSINDPVKVSAYQAFSDPNLPAPLNGAITYYISVVNGNTIKLLDAPGGTVIDLSTVGDSGVNFIVDKKEYDDVRVGDTVIITGGTNVTAGTYIVNAKVGGGILALDPAFLTGSSSTDIAGTVHSTFATTTGSVLLSSIYDNTESIVKKFKAGAGSLVSNISSTKLRLPIDGEYKYLPTTASSSMGNQSAAPTVTTHQAAVVGTNYSVTWNLVSGYGDSNNIRLFADTSLPRNYIKTSDQLYSLTNPNPLISTGPGQPLNVNFYGNNTLDTRNKSSISLPTDTITLASAHPWQTGQELMIYATGSNPLPAPLQRNVFYYAIVIDPLNVKLASTYANAIGNIPINITDDPGDLWALVVPLVGGPTGNFYLKVNYRTYEGLIALV